MDHSRRFAYLVSQYPATNHTFILREIQTLRKLGFDLGVASLRPCDRGLENLTEEERVEAGLTFYVRSQGIARLLGINLGVLTRRPAPYLKGLLYAARLAGPSPKRLLLHLGYFLQAMIVGDWMRCQKFDHVHTHFASTFTLLVGCVFPITWSATMHGPDEFNDPVAFHLAEKCRHARFLCTISHFGKSRLMMAAENLELSKVEVCRLGVDPDVFTPKPFLERPDRFELICVGRLAQVKGHRVLIDAIHRLVRKGRNLHLRVVGGGPLREAIEGEIRRLGLANHVVLEGPLNQDRVLELYREADVFALASFAEGVPVVLMEAMMMELPCVATWVNGVPELIRHEVDGLLVPAGDDEGLANAIERYMDDADLRKRVGKSARRQVLEHYNLNRNSGELAEIFGNRLSR